jgi:hypothetical protein
VTAGSGLRSNTWKNGSLESLAAAPVSLPTTLSSRAGTASDAAEEASSSAPTGPTPDAGGASGPALGIVHQPATQSEPASHSTWDVHWRNQLVLVSAPSAPVSA